MSKKYLVTSVLFVLALGAAMYLLTAKPSSPTAPAPAYKDATYIVEEKSVTLVRGMAQTDAAPGSATKVVTKYFGNTTEGDLNGDGVNDVVFLLIQDPGGSAEFFYVVAALKTSSGWRGTNAVLLGDRIVPQSTRIKDGVVTVAYTDRKPTDPMTTPPSVGKSMRLSLNASSELTVLAE